MAKQYAVYILTNEHHTVLYTGITNDLARRVLEHREKTALGFTAKYNVTRLVYAEIYENVEVAIEREKQIKNWSRSRKNKLVESTNPYWSDLYDKLLSIQMAN